MITIEELKKDRLLKPDEVAEIIKNCRKKVYALAGEGHFRFVMIGRSLRIWENSVYDYLRRLTLLSEVENGFLYAIEDSEKNEEK